MRCNRCNGLMSPEMTFNCAEGTSQGWLPISRCINCGFVEDAVIRQNRFRPQAQATGARACRQPRALTVFVNAEAGRTR